MPSPLSCLSAADSAEAKAVPQTQSEQGQQPRESVTRDDFPSPLLSSPQQSTLSLLLCRENRRGVRPGDWVETGSPSGARVASARTDERDSCEVAMKHFSEDDGWGWPVKGMAARSL